MGGRERENQLARESSNSAHFLHGLNPEPLKHGRWEGWNEHKPHPGHLPQHGAPTDPKA